jgi:hypothetical protein
MRTPSEHAMWRDVFIAALTGLCARPPQILDGPMAAQQMTEFAAQVAYAAVIETDGIREED